MAASFEAHLFLLSKLEAKQSQSTNPTLKNCKREMRKPDRLADNVLQPLTTPARRRWRAKTRDRLIDDSNDDRIPFIISSATRSAAQTVNHLVHSRHLVHAGVTQLVAAAAAARNSRRRLAPCGWTVMRTR